MGKVISTIIVLLLAPLFFVFVFFLSLKLTVMNPDFVKRELASQDAYRKIHANLPEAVSFIGKRDEPSPENKGPLADAEITVMIQKTITPETAKKTTELAIDAFWPWIFDGKQTSAVSMKELKTKARIDAMDFFRSKYESMPYCLSMNDFSEENMVCRIRGVKFDDVMSQLSADPVNNPLGMIENIPDSLGPDTLAGTKNSPLGNVESIRSFTGPLSSFLYVVPVILLIILTLLARLFAGAWKKVPEALGIFFIILGSVSLIFGLLVSKFGFSGIPGLIDKNLKDLPGLKTQVIVPMAKDILEKVGSTLNTVSISVLVAGIILTGGSIILLKVLSKDDIKTGSN